LKSKENDKRAITYDKMIRILLAIFIYFSFSLYPMGGLYIGYERLKLYVIEMVLFCIFLTITMNREIFKFIKEILLYKTKRKDKMGLLLIWNILLYISWACLSLLWSNDKVSTLVSLSKLVVMIYFSFCVLIYMNYYGVQAAKVILGSLLITVVLLLGIKIYKIINVLGTSYFLMMLKTKQVQSGNPIYSLFIYKVFATPPLGNSQNVTDSLIISYIGISILVYLQYKDNLNVRFYKFILVSTAVIGTMQLYIGISKTAFLSLCLLIFFLLIGYLIYKEKSILYVGCILIFINSLILLQNPFNIRNAVAERFSVLTTLKLSRVEEQKTQIEDVSINSRLELWKEALKIFENHKVCGSGYRSNKALYLRKYKVDNPHNIYLQTLSELGIIGFAFLVSIIIGWLLLAIKAIRKNQYILLCIGLIFIYFFRGLNGWQFEELDIWLLMFLAIYLYVKYFTIKIYKDGRTGYERCSCFNSSL
jgi:O-antigen ligase